MKYDRVQWLGRPRIALAAFLVAGCLSPMAMAQFLEPEVAVIRTHAAAVAGEAFGFVSESIGDINSDGASEYLIGAPFSNAGGSVSGRAVLYSGADGSVLNQAIGNPFNQLGYSVAGPGDVDGDGVNDYAVSGRGSFGGPGPQFGRLVVYSGADHSVILDVAGPGDRDFFGYDINAAGDVNGDGHADIIVGAPLDNSAAPRAGSVHVISGADGSTLWRQDGLSAFAFLGTGVSGIGDLDGDGLPEQAAAAVGGGKKFLGEAYLYSAIDGSIQSVLKPKQDGFNFGNFFVHNAGDTNKDGLNDILIGDFGNLGAGTDTGHAYIYLGGNTEQRRTIDGENPGDGFGIGRGVGDVDGDGHDDLFIAGFINNDGAVQGGKGYVYSGRNNMLIRTMTGNVAGAQLGFDAIGLGDVNGDGLIDFMLTGVDVAHVIAGNATP